MAIDPRIALNLQPLNVGQRLAKNVENLQQIDLLNRRREQAPFQNQLMQLQTELAQAQQPANLLQAERAASGLSQTLLDNEQMARLDMDNAINLNKAFMSGNQQSVIAALESQRAQAQQLGLTNDIMEAEQALTMAQTPEGLQQLKQGTDAFLQQASGQQQKSVSQRDFESKVSLVKGDPELKTPEAKAAAISLGLEAKAGSSAAERIANDPELSKLVADAEALKASAKETSKGISKREQGFIDSGIEAADSVNNIKRSLELLDTVKTGGFNNAALRIKQFFGVEGADEGELSGRLGVAVLAQLKPIFGAAFTAAEGERLERISARFGANPETNKRLLNDALSIAERAARRGLKAAQKSGDEFSAEEIQAVLDSFESIKDEVGTTTTTSTANDQGVIMVDANGNRARVFPDGTFEEL